jgi:transcriptional regulator with AAA-type ATPase domain
MSSTAKKNPFTTSWIEVATLEDMMIYFRGNKTACSKCLGITRNTFRKDLTNTPDKKVQVIRAEDGSIETFKLM